ncbi:replication factor C large subunit [Candidatus Woesearchaeota archaeon]|jgi:replication factor C large subunit|nr:replication factor C large subunit [Candidatus Woesearchaeota archaeon]MBT6519447.1 replication factor C large subunit [Candidatus Woesearchaeota archaeon]MBT7368891.1 replication factor C large subunit [Candidatus Woesearchaeota archaeon]
MRKYDKPWILKYIPANCSDVVGQDTAVGRLKDFVEKFKVKSSGKKAMFLYGPPGCGKTVSVYAIAKDLELEIIELNASDFRNKDHISSILGSATQQMSLFARGKLILVDEVDGISGTKDRGGLLELSKVIEKSSFPIIVVGENPYDQKMKAMRKICELVEFNILEYRSISSILKKIADLENIEYVPEDIDALARRAGGDLRAAINDLQILSSDGRLNKGELDELSERLQKQSIVDALLIILKTTDINLALSAMNKVDEDLNQLMLWLDENLPNEYTEPEDLANAYDWMSKADIMNRRIRRWQHWRFLVYVNAYLTGGVALSKKEKYKKFVQYKPTMRLLKLWQAKMKYQKRIAISEKLASMMHTSKRRVIQDVLPYMQFMMKKDQGLRADFAEKYELGADEVAWLVK